jgi:hypothetical protein
MTPNASNVPLLPVLHQAASACVVQARVAWMRFPLGAFIRVHCLYVLCVSSCCPDFACFRDVASLTNVMRLYDQTLRVYDCQCARAHVFLDNETVHSRIQCAGVSDRKMLHETQTSCLSIRVATGSSCLAALSIPSTNAAALPLPVHIANGCVSMTFLLYCQLENVKNKTTSSSTTLPLQLEHWYCLSLSTVTKSMTV